jgi:hypothetical protein
MPLKDSARGLPLAAVCGSALILAAGCRSPAVPADADKARSHIEMLAATIGSRPAGSRAAARARAYLVDELRQIGFEVRLQSTDSTDESRGLTVPVTNIIAFRDGTRPEAIALVAHYDSVPDASGALDDALGVAVCLEAARALVAEPRIHSLAVLLTDAEEYGLMGARAAVRDPDVAARVRAFLNFDGTGAAGIPMMFEAAAGPAIEAWAANAASPEGASFSTEIYRRLPNDTDFTIFKTLGVSGLNFAPVDDSYAYHTDRDVPDRVESETLLSSLSNTISTVRALDANDLGTTAAPGAPTPTYFDLAQRRGIVYGADDAAVVSWVSIALGAIAWLRLSLALWRASSARRLVLTLAWSATAAAASVAAMIGLAWTFRAARGELTPWYAEPHWFFASSIGIGLLAAMVVRRIAGSVADGWQPVRSPAGAWWTVLPAWIGLTMVLQTTAPAAAYLTAIPLGVAGGVLVLTGGRAWLVRLASVVVAAVAGTLWIADAFRLLSFSVPLFGWLPVVSPVWLHAALLAIVGLMCVPPLAAIAAGARPRWIQRAAVFAAAVVLLSGALAYRSPSFTPDRPERRSVRYIQDDRAGKAWWEIGSHAAVAPRSRDLDWQLVHDGPDASVRLPALRSAAVFRAIAAPVVTVRPASVTTTAAANATGIELAIVIAPDEYVTATLLLPEGVVPIESSLPGIVSSGRWRATSLAAPPTALRARLVVPGSAAAALADLAVVLTTSSVPPVDAGRGDRPWADNERVTWQPRSVFIVSGAPARVAGLPDSGQ